MKASIVVLGLVALLAPTIGVAATNGDSLAALAAGDCVRACKAEVKAAFDGCHEVTFRKRAACYARLQGMIKSCETNDCAVALALAPALDDQCIQLCDTAGAYCSNQCQPGDMPCIQQCVATMDQCRAECGSNSCTTQCSATYVSCLQTGGGASCTANYQSCLAGCTNVDAHAAGASSFLSSSLNPDGTPKGKHPH